MIALVEGSRALQVNEGQGVIENLIEKRRGGVSPVENFPFPVLGGVKVGAWRMIPGLVLGCPMKLANG